MEAVSPVGVSRIGIFRIGQDGTGDAVVVNFGFDSGNSVLRGYRTRPQRSGETTTGILLEPVP